MESPIRAQIFGPILNLLSTMSSSGPLGIMVMRQVRVRARYPFEK